MLKIEIKCRFRGTVIFAHEAEDNTIAITLKAAVLAGANLAGAYLDGAYLDGANLAGAYLDGAYLDGANLAGAYLDGANLAGAYLAGANLAGANLAGANLAGAYLDGANLAGAYLDGAYLDGANQDGKEELTGERPIFQIGPIGSRSAYVVFFCTKQGIRVRAGCFFGTLDAFKEKVIATHGENEHAKEYGAAMVLAELHMSLWNKETK